MESCVLDNLYLKSLIKSGADSSYSSVSVQMWLEPARGCITRPPRMIGMRKTTAMALRTTLTKERRRVTERMFSKAFHEFAFLRGLPDQTSRMMKIHRMSITMVITVSKSSCKQERRVA